MTTPVTTARGAGLTLVAATSAMVLLVLDSSIVGVMLPSIRRDLGLGAAQLSWVVAVYLVTLAALLPVGGQLSDALGATRTFVAGMAGFTVASFGVGVATAGWEIIGWRAAAGCAAALMMPAGLALLAEAYPDDRRAGPLAVYTGVGQGAAVLGPLVGGLCAQFLGWRWGFLVNVPVGLAGLALVALARPLNVRHAVSWAPRELVDVALLRNRRFTGAVVVLFALGFGMTAATIYGAAILQETLDLAPAAAGIALLPMVVPLLGATRWAARRYERIGPRVIGVRGSLVLALGLLGIGAGVAVDHLAVVCVALVPTGIGIGLLMSPMTNAALSSVPADRRGKASGLVSMLRQVGGIAGVWLMGALVAAWPATASGGPAPVPVALGFAVSAGLMAGAAFVAQRNLAPSLR